MLGYLFLQVFLLRATNDLKVWKLFQTAVLLFDAVCLWSLWVTLEKQDRLSLSKWRSEDWGCVVITLGVAVVRSAFLAEVGFRKIVGGGKRS